MEIRSHHAVIEIVDESVYSPGSADNPRRYDLEVDLTESGSHHTSRHGVIIDGNPAAIFMAGGGCSAVHDHSAFLLEGALYLAVGDHVVCIEISSHQIRWAVPVDSATCFGVHYSAKRDALLSHGELEVARFTRDGQILWSAAGADIFSEGFALREGWVEVLDFDRRQYRLDYDTGREIGT
jgi:outer membrane protein assembly factor BamB